MASTAQHNSSNNLTVCHCNARSLSGSGKLEELSSIASQNNINILAVSETWLTSNITNDLININGFNPPFRHDRKRPYGGVAVYVSDNICATRISEFENSAVESVWLSMKVSDKLIITGAFYRPPNQTADECSLFMDGSLRKHIRGCSRTPSCSSYCSGRI